MIDDSPYHAGERLVQELAGTREFTELMGRKMIRPFLSDSLRAFFAQLPFVVVGSVDADGQPWASMLVGEPGFVHAPDAHTLLLRALPHPSDPLLPSLQPGAALGLLGIELATRRRNRVNGRVLAHTADAFELHVDQAFGNCPKYIATRALQRRAASPPSAAGPRESARLSDAACALIRAADTCFLASASAREASPNDAREGADISHRGGQPGFIRVDRTSDATTLVMPDFAGNNAFNTLGNLTRYPRAGLLFPDFVSGDLLLLTCEAGIVWGGAELARFRGAERLLELRVCHGSWLRRWMPFTWSVAQPGPHTDRTGHW